MESLKRRFIKAVYGGDYKRYLRARKSDYCKVQFEWACWIDALCESGEITQQQYDRTTF